MQAQIKKAILKAMAKFTELSLSQELADSNHFLKVELSPRGVSLWLFSDEIKIIDNWYLTHPSESGVSAEICELETDKLIEKIKVKFSAADEALSAVNTEVNE